MWEEIQKASSYLTHEYSYVHRAEFCSNYAWAIPSPEIIRKIAEFANGGKILEIGAGNGLWARLLHDAGADIIATDNYQWNEKDPIKMKFGKFFPVEKMDATLAVKTYPSDVLLTIWPPYRNEMAFLALKEFKGDKVVYVGEDNGCTGSVSFHDLLLNEWEDNGYYPIPQWGGIHDFAMFYSRKK